MNEGVQVVRCGTAVPFLWGNTPIKCTVDFVTAEQWSWVGDVVHGKEEGQTGNRLFPAGQLGQGADSLWRVDEAKQRGGTAVV